jgi:UDP-N-acetylglucosamine diphosphorylase/glucosamine-1-phosphate N-acetyltransferase
MQPATASAAGEEVGVSVLPVIFEDESLAGFRPLAWSVPVGELRCGVLNLRERVEHVTGQRPVLLLRRHLEDLAGAHGHAVDPARLRTHVAGGGRLLLVSGRLGAGWDTLAEAWRTAQYADLAWRDDCGWLALAAGGDAALELVGSWEAWRRSARDSGCWRRPDVAPPPWRIEPPAEVGGLTGAFRRIWDLVPATGAALRGDLERLAGRLPARRIWGAVPLDPAADWTAAVDLRTWDAAPLPGVQVRGGERFLLGPECDLAPGVAVDAGKGPVVLGRNVRVLPHCYLEGPLFIGSGSLVKAGAAIYGETSLGAAVKVAGEVGESTVLDLANKQHDGFLGHAYVGSWCNLGAGTTCSDLKNNYGTIRVDLGGGAEDSGQRFVGLLMGEHCKTAIGTLFNTGTTVGFASNVFGAGFPAKFLPCYTWGDGAAAERQDPERALATARTALARRGCELTTGHAVLFRHLGG